MYSQGAHGGMRVAQGALQPGQRLRSLCMSESFAESRAPGPVRAGESRGDLCILLRCLFGLLEPRQYISQEGWRRLHGLSRVAMIGVILHSGFALTPFLVLARAAPCALAPARSRDTRDRGR